MGKKELTKKQLKKSLKNITEGSVQMKDHLKTAYNAMKSLDKVSTGQTIKNEKGDNVTVTPSDNKKILAAMRKVEDLYRDIIGGEIKDKEDNDEKEKSTEVTAKNEKSEGHGKMPFEVVGENTVKISQKKLNSIIKRVIIERKKQLNEQQWPPKPTYEQSQDLKQIKACVNTIVGYQYNREGHSPYIGGTFMTEFMWHLQKSFDKDAENAKEIEYKIKKCFRNTVFWDEYGKSLRFLGDDRKFRQEMKRLERGHIEGDVQ